MFLPAIIACVISAPVDIHVASSVQTFYTTPSGPGVSTTQGGSGTIIKVGDGKFWVVSCYHIAHNSGDMSGELRIRTASKTHKARLLAYDRDRDLSLIEVEGDTTGKPAPLASEKVKPGETVTKVGYPRAGPRVIASGKVLPLINTAVGKPHIVSFVASCVSISGDSGGGVFRDGKLVGVIWGGREDGLRATGIDDVRDFLERAKFSID